MLIGVEQHAAERALSCVETILIGIFFVEKNITYINVDT